MHVPDYLVRRDDIEPGHRVVLVGSHRSVAWPRMCANCAAPTNERITVSKIFGRYADDGEGSSWYRILTRQKIPYCPRCIDRYRQIVQSVPGLRVSFFFNRDTLLSTVGLVVLVALALIFLLKDVFESP